MPTVSRTEPIDAPADAVWALVGDFADDSWTGVAITCDGAGVGATRAVAMPGGDVVERCDRLDDADRSMAYTVVSGNPFPVSTCAGEIQVVEAGERSEVHWKITYEPDAGVDGDGVARDLSGLLEASTAALRAAAERAARP